MNTTTCNKCNDKGVIHIEVGGGFLFQPCNCRPVEYWDLKFKKDMETFRRRFEEWRKTIGGGEKGGEVQHAGR